MRWRRTVAPLTQRGALGEAHTHARPERFELPTLRFEA